MCTKSCPYIKTRKKELRWEYSLKNIDYNLSNGNTD
jgi:hypothetical protein